MTNRPEDDHFRRMHRRIGQLEQFIRQNGLEAPAWGDEDHVANFELCLTGKVTMAELAEILGVSRGRAQFRLERWYQQTDPKPLSGVARDVFQPWIDGTMTLRDLARAHAVPSLDLWWRLWSRYAPEEPKLKSISMADSVQYYANRITLKALADKYGMDKGLCRSRLANSTMSDADWFAAAERGEIRLLAIREKLSYRSSTRERYEDLLTSAVADGSISVAEFQTAGPGETCPICQGSGKNWDVNLANKTSRKITCIKCNGWGSVDRQGNAWPFDMKALQEKKQAKG